MLTITNEEEFANWITNLNVDVISRYEEHKQSKERESKSYSVHQTQNIIRKGNKKTLELIHSGKLKINNEGKVIGSSINEYLRKRNEPEELNMLNRNFKTSTIK